MTWIDWTKKGINPWSDVLTEEEYRDLFGFSKHVFTGVDYIEYYKDLIRSCGCEVQIVLANDCRTILRYTKNVLCCDIHTRARSKRLLQAAGAEKSCAWTKFLNHPVEGSGWNEEYGLLGSNKATEEKIKAVPSRLRPYSRTYPTVDFRCHRQEGRGHGLWRRCF